MASISDRENREIEAANASGAPPVVFIHGLWLLPSSWEAWADFFTQAGYKRQRRNPGVMEIVKIPNRGHSLTIDHGWREVAQAALDFIKRLVPGTAA